MTEAKYLITGVGGFIGSTLAEKLLESGGIVRGVDCFTDYYSPEIKRNNIKKSLSNPNFELIEADLAEAELTELFNDVEYVFHLAAQPGVRKSWGKDFQIYIDQNIKATQRMLEETAKHPVKKIVYASSSSVYGETKQLPMKEDIFVEPVSPYGVTKLAAENLFQLYHRAFGVPAVSLRLFTVYGPRQRPDMAFNKFMKLILKNEPLEIFGDGKQTRDFTYVEDVADAFISASLKGKPGAVYNIGGGNRISLIDLIELLGEVTGKKIKVNHIEAQKGEMTHTYANCEKAVRDLDYSPAFDLKKGLKNEWDWIKTLRGE